AGAKPRSAPPRRSEVAPPSASMLRGFAPGTQPQPVSTPSGGLKPLDKSLRVLTRRRLGCDAQVNPAVGPRRPSRAGTEVRRGGMGIKISPRAERRAALFLETDASFGAPPVPSCGGRPSLTCPRAPDAARR